MRYLIAALVAVHLACSPLSVPIEREPVFIVGPSTAGRT